ncbi:MAG: tetratricopeptide repeat protein [Alphaproteobacteria bacterium]|jgi:predicted TPR repeat methyltransferase|nr:tetratricopeptide repeat protein [Alphaproteobacteria bacterium]
MSGNDASNQTTGPQLDALVQEGLRAHQAGNLEAAEDIYRKVLSHNADHADANHFLGVIAFQVGMAEQSLELISRAIGFNPENALYYSNLGNTLQALGRSDEAIASHRKALVLSPNLSVSHNSLGFILQEQGNLEDAVTSFDQAIAANPKYAEAHSNRGIALRKLGRFEDAAESYLKAIAINPGYAEAHNNLGSALRAQDKLDSAVDSFRRAIAIKPDFTEAHSNLGNTLKKLGRPDEALECYHRALDLDPARDDIRHLISSISGETTDIAPEKYICGLFDDYADRFDDHLTNDLAYKIPSLLRRAVDATPEGPETFSRALDLGCGTGMVAENFQGIVGEIDGVDLSEKMLEQADGKGVYANLYLTDVLRFLEMPDVRPAGYDLVLSADTFIYIGKLDGIFKATRRALADGGLFAFSVEYLEDGDYKLLPSSRYSQSEAYIRKLADDCDFTVLSCEPTDVRTENETPIPGRIFVLQAAG